MLVFRWFKNFEVYSYALLKTSEMQFRQFYVPVPRIFFCIKTIHIIYFHIFEKKAESVVSFFYLSFNLYFIVIFIFQGGSSPLQISHKSLSHSH